MNVWTLVLILDAGLRSATPVVIDNLPSYDECRRVGEVILSNQQLMSTQNNKFGADYYRPEWSRSLCVEHKIAERKETK